MEKLPHVAVTHISVIDVRSKAHPPKKVPARDFYALSYRISGEVSLETDEKTVRSLPGSITFTPKGMSYLTEIQKDTHMIAVHFRLHKDIDFRTPFVLLEVGAEAEALFWQLLECYRVSSPLDFECMSVFYRLLSHLEHLGNAKSNLPPCISQAKRLMDENFRDPELSIGEIARTINVSDSYLRRAFRAHCGESPSDYLIALRIRHAKALLQSEFFTVSEIALQCGFHSACYFIQCFRTQVGTSPAAYRKKHRSPE